MLFRSQTWAKSASDAVNPNKPDECKGEVYEFRYIWDTSLSDTSGDTGWIRFKVIKDKIQFQNFPVLVLVGGGNLPMYDAKTGAVLETGTFIGGEWPMDARNSLVGSSVSEGSIKLAPFFARRNNMAAYDSRWSCYMCAIGHEVNMDETWAKQDAAFAPIKDLTDGVEFARRKAAMKASGEVRWYLRYLGEG